MSYAAPRTPKLILRAIVGAIVGGFVWILTAILGPQIYTSYQWSRIMACEDEYGLLTSDKTRNFGFDAGGWTVTAKNERTRAFADCVRSRFNVPATLSGEGSDPVIGVFWNSARLHPTISISYYPGEPTPSQE